MAGEPSASRDAGGDPPVLARSRSGAWLLWTALVVLISCALAVALLSGASAPPRPRGRAAERGRPGALPPHCAGAWAAAAGASGAERPPDSLDPAIRACPDLAAWERAAARYPRALGDVDPAALLRRRCAGARPLRSVELCRRARNRFSGG